MISTDFAVIGAGIAGASVAYELSNNARVVVLERESQPGYHSTGRSAALFSEIYGNAVVRALSRASRSFLYQPPGQFTDTALLAPRGVLYIGTQEAAAAFAEFRAAPDVKRDTRELNSDEACALVPILRESSVAVCAFEPAAMDVEAASLHQGFVRGMKSRGCTLLTNCEITTIERHADHWLIRTADQTIHAHTLINAAGAWTDEVALLAGVKAIGIQPMRRTALLVQPPAGAGVEHWPMVMALDESFYFKPDAGKLLLSPADETPSPPCDAQPEDLDVAIAVDRFEQATTLSVDRVTHSWAGLRCFVADRSPGAGFDADAPGIFWLTGQGGYGIQTAPALSRAAAALAQHQPIPADILDHGLGSEALSPLRLRR